MLSMGSPPKRTYRRKCLLLAYALPLSVCVVLTGAYAANQGADATGATSVAIESLLMPMKFAHSSWSTRAVVIGTLLCMCAYLMRPGKHAFWVSTIAMTVWCLTGHFGVVALAG